MRSPTDHAVYFIQHQGMKVLDRHWQHTDGGFIDIVAVDRHTLVAVQIVPRIPRELSQPAQRRQRGLAVAWMKDHGKLYPQLRVDYLTVDVLPGGINIEYAKGMA